MFKATSRGSFAHNLLQRKSCTMILAISFRDQKRLLMKQEERLAKKPKTKQNKTNKQTNKQKQKTDNTKQKRKKEVH